MKARDLLPEGVISALRPGVIQGRRLAKGRRRVNLSEGVSCQFFGDNEKHTFFGYYDLSPFEPEGKRLLACRVERKSPTGAMEIGTYEADHARNQRFAPLARTETWCWQQGCRLAWVPQLGKAHILFNSLGQKRFEAVLLDAEARQEITRFPKALYDVSSDGRYGLSLNFSRLQRLRPGYGYGNLGDATEGERAPAGDGIQLVDLDSGDSRLLHSLAEVAQTLPQPSMADATHYFNHLSWNPSGTRFLFFHIWEQQGQRREIRLLTSDPSGNLRVVTNGRLISHYCWIDDIRLLIYGEMGGAGGYFEIEDCSADRQSPVSYEGLPRQDGHPTWNEAAGSFLFDTLPDRLAERHLMTYRSGNSQPHRLGSFYSPPAQAGEFRCDLHPRWSRDGRRVAIDTDHAGYRQMGVVTTQTTQLF